MLTHSQKVSEIELGQNRKEMNREQKQQTKRTFRNKMKQCYQLNEIEKRKI